MQYDHIKIPDNGEAITANTDHTLVVPDFPIVPLPCGGSMVCLSCPICPR